MANKFYMKVWHRQTKVVKIIMIYDSHTLFCMQNLMKFIHASESCDNKYLYFYKLKLKENQTKQPFL